MNLGINNYPTKPKNLFANTKDVRTTHTPANNNNNLTLKQLTEDSTAFTGKTKNPHANPFKVKNGKIELIGPKDIGKLTPCDVLMIIPHPDDIEVFFPQITKFLEDKKSVQLVYTTSGQKGRDSRGLIPRYDPKMKDQRESELKEALATLGVKRNPLLLGKMDGATHRPEVQTQIKPMLKDIIFNTQPKEIHTFGPEGMTNHSDHKATRAMVADVMEDLKAELAQEKDGDWINGTRVMQVGLTTKQVEEYKNITAPTTPIFKYLRNSQVPIDEKIELTKDGIDKIVDATTAYGSQFPDKAPEAVGDYYKNNPFVRVGKVKI